MKKKCLFLFLLLSCLIILRPRVLCDLAKKELYINNIVLQSIKDFISINFIISKKNNSDSAYAKARKRTINNFCEINKNNVVCDKGISDKVTKFILEEYLNCRVGRKGGHEGLDKKCGASCSSNSVGHALRSFSVGGWCPCRKARASTRIYLILHIINELERMDSKRDKNKELVYVSFGSGKLLQDYLTIKGLIAAGFKNINVNLIDLGYANNFDKDIDYFFKTYCKYNDKQRAQDSSEERDALQSFCELVKSGKCVKVINSYTTYFDFLQKWGKKPVDILLLIDPMSLRAELLNSRDPVYANHVCVSNLCINNLGAKGVSVNNLGINGASKNSLGVNTNNFGENNILFLLPYEGKPKIFYKGCLDKNIKDYLKYCCDFYNNYGDRKDFVRVVNAMKLSQKPFLCNCKLALEPDESIGVSQSQRFSFYDIIKSTVSENALIYQLDNNKIYFGKLNLLKDEYKKEGYKALK